MASDLKLDLAMTASQRGPNVQLMGNPAVQEGATNCPPCECVSPHPLGAEHRITLPPSPCSAADSFCRSRGCNQSGDYRPSPLLHRRGARRASCICAKGAEGARCPRRPPSPPELPELPEPPEPVSHLVWFGRWVVWCCCLWLQVNREHQRTQL